MSTCPAKRIAIHPQTHTCSQFLSGSSGSLDSGYWSVRALAFDAEAEKTAREANQTIVGTWETRDHSVWFEFTAEGQFSVSWPPNPHMDRESRDEPLFRGRYSIVPGGEIEISDLQHPRTERRLLVEQGCRFKAQLFETGRIVRITGSTERRGTIVVPTFGDRVFGKVELPPKGEEELNLYRVR